MCTPPDTPYTSPPQPGPRAYDDDLLDFALKRIENEGNEGNEGSIQKVARRLFADELPPPSTPISRTLTPAPSSTPSDFAAPPAPESAPTKRKRKRKPEPASPSAFSTPPRGRFPTAQPVTPGWARKKPKDESSIFPGEILTTTNDLSPIDMQAPFSVDVVYQDAKGNNHNLFRQPDGSKSCFAYSLAMLLSDIMRSGTPLNLDTTFWEWFQNAYLLNDEKVQAQASRIGVKLECTPIPEEEPLVHIREQIKKSGFPVLTSINHPTFCGHEIVVDSVTDTHTTIRDPYSGKAWKVPNEKMKLQYQDIAQEKCLSVKQP